MTEHETTTRPGTPAHDPFATLGYPSLSFKDKAHGYSYRVQVVDHPEWVQCVDDDGKLTYWKNDDGSNGSPKMAAVTNVRILLADGQPVTGSEDPDDWHRSVWAVKPSALYHAIRRGSKASGPVEPGGILIITYTGDGPKPASKLHSPQKLYDAVYVAAVPGADTDAPF